MTSKKNSKSWFSSLPQNKSEIIGSGLLALSPKIGRHFLLIVDNSNRIDCYAVSRLRRTSSRVHGCKARYNDEALDQGCNVSTD